MTTSQSGSHDSARARSVSFFLHALEKSLASSSRRARLDCNTASRLNIFEEKCAFVTRVFGTTSAVVRNWWNTEVDYIERNKPVDVVAPFSSILAPQLSLALHRHTLGKAVTDTGSPSTQQPVPQYLPACTPAASPHPPPTVATTSHANRSAASAPDIPTPHHSPYQSARTRTC